MITRTKHRLRVALRRVTGLTQLEERIEELQKQVDMLKSSLEVPREQIAEYQDWKARHPLPPRPLVSVCVGTYNRAQLLTERCIPSVLGQTYAHLELIVVGDGCTDDTGECVARIQDPRLTFVNLPERGNYPEDPNRRWMVAGTHSMNHALSLARGDFITHLDDDDEYTPDRLEKLVEFAAAYSCDFVWHPFWFEALPDFWLLNEAHDFAVGQVTTSSVFYRHWFKRITWNIESHMLLEPGDWNRFRRIAYMNPTALRCPKPLLRHYRERTQVAGNAQASPRRGG